MDNLYQQFKAVFPDAPLFVGTVQSVSGGVATVQLPDGGVLRARGTAGIRPMREMTITGGPA